MRDVPFAPLGWKLGDGGDVEGASNPFWCARMGEGCPRRLIGTVISNPRSDGLRVNRRWGKKKKPYFILCVKHSVQKSTEVTDLRYILPVFDNFKSMFCL